MFDLTKLYSYLAPIATPVPSSLFIATDIYNRMYSNSVSLAWIAAIGAFVGFEACGGCCTAGVVKLHNKHRYGWDFWLCFLGILVYVGMGATVLWLGASTWVFLVLTPFAVFGANVLWTLWNENAETTKAAELELEQQKLQLKNTRAQTKLLKLQQTEQNPAKSEQNFACSICGAQFSSIKALNGHKRVHK